MIVRWDRPHRHVEIVRVGIWTSRVPHGSWTLDVFPRSIMYIRLSEYWVFWDISLHGIILHCISSHHSFLMTICFVWCLENIKCWFPLLMKLYSKCNIYIYILVQSKNLFSYITPVTTSSLSVNETYWVHVVSYSYYACCTLCGADSIPSRSTSRGANWVRLEVLGVVVSCLAVPWPTPPSIFYLFCY